MSIDFDLKGDYILLAGAFRGIGFELAKLLLSCGSKVILIGKNKKSSLKTKQELNKYFSSDNFSLITCDIYKENKRTQLVNDIQNLNIQKINHFVSFIGSGKTQPGINFNTNHWFDVFNKNFFSVVDLVNILLPILSYNKDRMNSIILTSAIAGLERVGAPATYSCAKSALTAYISHLAEHLSDKNIRVNGVSPGNIYFKGGRWEEIIAEKGQEFVKSNVLENVSLKRFGNAQELAWTYLNILSPRNSFLNGTNVIIDGQQIKRII